MIAARVRGALLRLKNELARRRGAKRLERRNKKISHMKIDEMLAFDHAKAAFEESLVLLNQRKVALFAVDGLVGNDDFPYAESVEARKEFRYYTLLNDPEAFADDLREIYSADHPAEYYKTLAHFQVIGRIGMRSFFPDYSSGLVNYLDGKRVTEHQPKSYKRTLHVYGQCTVVGQWVPDDQTLCSQLQLKMSEGGYSDTLVVNEGMHGENHMSFINLILDSPTYHEGDAVMIYAPDKNLAVYLEGLGFEVLRIKDGWPINETTTTCVYDNTMHPGPKIYELLAEKLFEYLAQRDFKTAFTPKKQTSDLKAYAKFLKSSDKKKLERPLLHYTANVFAKVPADLKDAKRVGAIVMNANPFTAGHRYLVEYASNQVDLLYVFCASADTSLFSTEDRLEMVKQGTADLPNVVVASSGRVFANTETFPEYHIQELSFDKTEVGAKDILLFSRYIAPQLGIKKRFVGEEAPGSLTKSFNEHMARALPRHGIELVEIPRHTEGGEVVSASKVRSLLAQGDIEALRPLVPQSTYVYIKKMREEGRI